MWRSVPAAGALKARRRDSRTLEDAGTAAASLIDQASVVDFLVDDAGLVERPAEDPAVVHRRCELAEGKI